MTQNDKGSEGEQAAVRLATELWDSIIDDDACCIGHPDGAEFVDEAIVPKLAKALLRQFDDAKEMAAQEAESYKEFDNGPYGIFDFSPAAATDIAAAIRALEPK